MTRRTVFDYTLEADRVEGVTHLPLRERAAAASNDQDVKDQEDKTKIEAREASAFWRGALASPVGQREMFKLLTLMRSFETSPFAASPSGAPDNFATFYNAGQIELGRGLYQMLAIVARDELFALQDAYNVYGALAVRPDRKD